MRLIAFGEILFRVLLTYGMSDYLSGPPSQRGGKKWANPEHLLKELAARPGDAVLKEASVCFARCAADRSDGAFVGEISAWASSRSADGQTRDEQLGWLVSLRNRAAHDARSPSAEAEAGRAAEYLALLRDVMESIDPWLGRYRLVHIESAQPTGDGLFSGRVVDLMGDSSTPHVFSARWRGWLATRNTYLVNPSGDAALLLSPLAQWAVPDDRGPAAFWLFRKVGSRTGEVMVVDDFGGAERWHELARDAGPVRWAEWLDSREEHRKRVQLDDVDSLLAAPTTRLTVVSSDRSGGVSVEPDGRSSGSRRGHPDEWAADGTEVESGRSRFRFRWAVGALLVLVALLTVASVVAVGTRADGDGPSALPMEPAEEGGAPQPVPGERVAAGPVVEPPAVEQPAAVDAAALDAASEEPQAVKPVRVVAGVAPELAEHRDDVAPDSDSVSLSSCAVDAACLADDVCLATRCAGPALTAARFIVHHNAAWLADDKDVYFGGYAQRIRYWFNRTNETREHVRSRRASGMPPPGDSVIENLHVIGATRDRAVVLADTTRVFPSGSCEAPTKLFVLEPDPRGVWSIVGEMDGPDHAAYPADAPELPRFHSTPCGAVFDMRSGLEWLVGRDPHVNERELEAYLAGEPSCCGSSSAGSVWRWRLPTEDEWRTLQLADGPNPVLEPVESSAFWLEAPTGPGLVRADGGRLVQTRDRYGGLLLVRWRLPAE